MTTTTYRMAGLQASAATSRACSPAPAATNASGWSIAGSFSVLDLAAHKSTKPATQMFVDGPDHRRRRLSEPSP